MTDPFYVPNSQYPLCLWCKHFDVEAYNANIKYRCTAFPNVIPPEITFVACDHRLPYPGDDIMPSDNGIQFEKYEDKEKLSKKLHWPDPEIGFYYALQDILKARAEESALPPLSSEEAEFYKNLEFKDFMKQVKRKRRELYFEQWREWIKRHLNKLIQKVG